MNNFLGLCIFSLIGCGPVGQPYKYNIDPELQEYVTRFINLSIQEQAVLMQVSLTARMVPKFTKPTILGQCTNSQTRLVEISQEWWTDMNDADREQLVFHELGHCLLNRDHVDHFTVDQNETIPVSIMDSVLFSYLTYSKHRVYYIHELFHP